MRLGCGAVDKGANQPNIFGDEKSAEDGRPYFSSGVPDGLIQRQVLRAHFAHWGDSAVNPEGMVALDRIYCWTWDARPYPSFPNLTEVWADGTNHRTGHWLTGRLGALSGEELASAIAEDFGCEVSAVSAAPLIAGLEVNAPTTARAALEPVLDMTGQSLVARAGATVGTLARPPAQHLIDRDHLVALEDAAVLSRRRGQAEERPDRLGLGYFDREKDYLAGIATAIRPGEGPLVSQSMPVSLDTAAARQASEHLLNRRAAAGDQIEFALPMNVLALEAGDIIAVAGLAEGPFEIAEIRDGAVRRISAKALARGDAVATGVEAARSRASPPAPDVTPHLIAAHIPASPSEPLRSRLVVAAYAKPWPGSIRVTEEMTGAGVGTILRPASMGQVEQDFASGAIGSWDEVNTLEVHLLGGHLADASDAAVLAGANRIAVKTNAGDWEIIGFAQAELVSPARYRLSRLWRGANGSDAAIGPVSAGNEVIVLDERVLVVPVDSYRLGASLALRCFAGPVDLTGVEFSVSLDQAPALPLAPTALNAERQSNDDILLRWQRRSRGVADGWSGGVAPLEHVPETYVVTILEGGTPLRTMTVNSASVVYTNAQQNADFGSLPHGFDWTVSQVSVALGAGHVGKGQFNG